MRHKVIRERFYEHALGIDWKQHLDGLLESDPKGYFTILEQRFDVDSIDPDELSRTFTAQIEAVRKELRVLPADTFTDEEEHGGNRNGVSVHNDVRRPA